MMAGRTTTKTVVVVEDDQDDYLILQQLFRQYCTDCITIPIHDSTTVVAELDQLKVLPDLILIDLIMPLQDGFEVLTQLRSHTRYAAVVIAIMSGLETPEYRARAVELGADHYLIKPDSLSQADHFLTQLFGT
ncbi:response regulator [Fibrisoma montanum]|uniref:Response regulator n=1 Tax=Fibrisoma montanum TaxID=2305895 RepID=A0A418MIZ9_9BACT|nr:response regulator [Fibrisoma montanum]RIV27377.1 response regulator [Fibrisoma montanum]